MSGPRRTLTHVCREWVRTGLTVGSLGLGVTMGGLDVPASAGEAMRRLPPINDFPDVTLDPPTMPPGIKRPIPLPSPTTESPTFRELPTFRDLPPLARPSDRPLGTEFQPADGIRPPTIPPPVQPSVPPPVYVRREITPSPVASSLVGPAPGSCDKSARLAPYHARLATVDEHPAEHFEPCLPPGFDPWWQKSVSQRQRSTPASLSIDVRELVYRALDSSQQIKAIGDQPLIRETAIWEAQAEFDVKAFMESKFIRTSDPVGDTLKTGGPPRFRESDWGYKAGLRKKTLHGGKLEVSQRIGYRDNNSLFFLPAAQGNSRLVLSFEQPLLNGAGKAYNTSLVVLAELDTAIAWDQASRDLQRHLFDVTKAYWDLYLQRASLLQMQRWQHRAQEILTELEQRQGIDSLRSQVARARSAVATRKSELIRAATAVRNAEAKLRSLVNAEDLASGSPELLPREQPADEHRPLALREALVTALENRPEIDEALRQLKASAVRLEMSRNELLPSLSLILETYVAGLQGDTELGQAWTNQFTKGEPGYTAGLMFEMPLQRRAAHARNQRRELELRQLTSQFRASVESLLAEVEVAVRDADTAFRGIHAKYAAMNAADAELQYTTERWRLLPGDDRAASFLLEDLLGAQDRLAGEEFGFAQSQVTYAVALVELNRATGMLLKKEQIVPRTQDGCGLPQIRFESANGGEPETTKRGNTVYVRSGEPTPLPHTNRTPEELPVQTPVDTNSRYPAFNSVPASPAPANTNLFAPPSLPTLEAPRRETLFAPPQANQSDPRRYPLPVR